MHYLKCNRRVSWTAWLHSQAKQGEDIAAPDHGKVAYGEAATKIRVAQTPPWGPAAHK